MYDDEIFRICTVYTYIFPKDGHFNAESNVWKGGKRSTDRLKEDCAWEYSFVDLLSFKTFSRGALIAYISEDEK